jgi:hypothetical protein
MAGLREREHLQGVECDAWFVLLLIQTLLGKLDERSHDSAGRRLVPDMQCQVDSPMQAVRARES